MASDSFLNFDNSLSILPLSSNRSGRQRARSLAALQITPLSSRGGNFDESSLASSFPAPPPPPLFPFRPASYAAAAAAVAAARLRLWLSALILFPELACIEHVWLIKWQMFSNGAGANPEEGQGNRGFAFFLMVMKEVFTLAC